MADQSIIVCPHCNKSSKLIPLKNPPAVPSGNSSPGSLFSSISTSFVDDPPTEPTEYTNTSQSSFWRNESVTHALAAIFAGCVLVGYSWWYEVPNGVIVAGTMLALIIGLPILKIWLHKPTAIQQQASEPGKTTIQVEHISDDKAHWIMAELNPAITQTNLSAVARAVVDNDFTWSMAANCKAGLTQPKHHKLKDDFVNLGYLVPLANGANGFTVSGQGRRFFRQVALSPTP